MEIPEESKRLRILREEMGLTQMAFAEKFDIGATSADIERGRTKLSGHLVMRLLREHHINPLWLYGESEQKHLNPHSQDVAPKLVSVDNIGQQNIIMVHEKAAAGYAGNIGDPEYYKTLPAFTFPLPEYRHASFRGFQVQGDSMYPALHPREWVIARAIADITHIQNEHIYVIVEQDSIRVKKLINHPDQLHLQLISIHPDYPDEIVRYADIQELWEFHSKLTQELSTHSPDQQWETLYEELQSIRRLLSSPTAR